jgi:Holliday junction DNA helicase RuvB
MNLDPTTSGYNSEEFDLEKIETIIVDDFAGQDQILENLKVFVGCKSTK